MGIHLWLTLKMLPLKSFNTILRPDVYERELIVYEPDNKQKKSNVSPETNNSGDIKIKKRQESRLLNDLKNNILQKHKYC